VSPAGRVEILRPGPYHGDEVPADAAGPWWCLLSTAGGPELRPCQVSVTAEHDPIFGDDSGKAVAVDLPGEVALMVRGAEALRPGPVATFFAGLLVLMPDQGVALGTGDDRWFVAADGKIEPRGPDTLLHDYRLTLSRCTTSQVLAAHLLLATDGVPSLHWAGDLDRDGAMDLLLDLTDHYNVTELALFLSSAAQDGELVRRVATLRTTGC
jgi:hypothetical protein